MQVYTVWKPHGRKVYKEKWGTLKKALKVGFLYLLAHLDYVDFVSQRM